MASFIKIEIMKCVSVHQCFAVCKRSLLSPVEISMTRSADTCWETGHPFPEFGSALDLRHDLRHDLGSRVNP